MPTGTALQNQIGFAKETTPGTPVPVVRFFGFDTETLGLKKGTVQGSGLYGGQVYEFGSRRQLASLQAAGDVQMDFPTIGAGMLLQAMLGSFGAAAPAQIGTSAAYRQIHNSANMLGNALTVQKGIADTTGTVNPFTYPGSKVTGWEISSTPSGLAKLKLTLDTINELTAAAGGNALLQAAAYSPSSAGFVFAGAQVLAASSMSSASGIWTPGSPTPLATVTSIDIKSSTPLDTGRFYAGSLTKSEQLENGYRKTTAEVDIHLNSLTMYNHYAADDALALQVNFVGPPIGGGNNSTLTFSFPHVRFEDGASPATAGPGITSEKLPLTILSDGVIGAVQAVYISTDVAI